MSGICISQALIKLRQIHVQLNAVQRSLGGALGQMSQSSAIFENSVFIVFLESRNFPANGVQPIVFRIESSGTLDKRLGIFNGTDSHFGLRRGKLQT